MRIEEHLDATTKAGWQLDHFSTNTHYNGTIMHSFDMGRHSEKPQPEQEKTAQLAGRAVSPRQLPTRRVGIRRS